MPSFDINTSLAKVSTSMFPPFIKVHSSTICKQSLRHVRRVENEYERDD